MQVKHWDLSEKCGFDREANRYGHRTDPVCESEGKKLPWDFKIETDRYVEDNQPDIVLLNIDVACSLTPE